MKKEKYLQIFNYLKEFSKLRSNPVRDIGTQENYKQFNSNLQVPDGIVERSTTASFDAPSKIEISEKTINHESIIRIKYLNKDKEVLIQLVDHEIFGYQGSNNIQKIYNKSVLANSIMGKSVGDSVRVGTTDYYIEIMEILE